MQNMAKSSQLLQKHLEIMIIIVESGEICAEYYLVKTKFDLNIYMMFNILDLWSSSIFKKTSGNSNIL